MELLVMALVFFAIALLVRRREAFQLRWRPTRHTWIAVGTGLLAFGLSASVLLLYDTAPLGASIVVYGLIFAGCGFALPWGYVLLVERGTAAALGLTRERWVVSLILSLVLAALFVPLLVLEGNLGAVGWVDVAKASFVLTGVGGLFELFLYYGFIHLRLDKAFGMIPAILLSAAIYVLWHVGTQLTHEPDPVAAVCKLFLVGVMYQSVFSMTRNVVIIWPFFHAAGVMIDFAVNLEAVEEMGREFPWAVGTMALMIFTGVLLSVLTRRRGQARAHPHSIE